MPGLNDNLRRLKSKFTHSRRLSRTQNASNGTTHTAETDVSEHSKDRAPVDSSRVHEPVVTLPIPQIAIQPAEAQPEVSSPDAMDYMVKSGVYDKVLAGTEKKEGGKFHKILEHVDMAMEATSTAAEAAAPFQELLSSEFVSNMEEKVSSFAENIPWLMNVLDEVTALHPAIQVVALAFKAAYHIEMTRRENDKRIKTLYVEMKEMIHVLIQLRDVKDPDVRDPYGYPLSNRLEQLSQKAAVDIKDCANVCDTFARKGPLIRILKGSVWERRLVSFIGRFEKRRTQFQQALATHTALVVESIELTVKAIDARLDMITKLFHKYTPPDELKLAKSIEEKGKDLRTIQNDEKDLRDLIELEFNLDSSTDTDPKKGTEKKTGGGKDRGMKRLPLTIKELREELREGLDESIQKNLTFFEGKFMLYHRQMHENLLKVMQENHSQLLVAMQGGPHERITNKELRKIWHDMNWRRNVKSRLFVMTLRDHFQDKLLETKLTARKIKVLKTIEDARASRLSLASMAVEDRPPLLIVDHESEDASSVDSLEASKDDWAYHYISLAWLQPIMEAFDDDGSGYITVTEVNRFSESMPKELKWTLQHWIAYWAIGWQISADYYRSKILNIFADMFEILPKLQPTNRYWADYYLGKVWPYVAQLLFALQREDLPDLQYKFQPFIDYEEARIKKNLKDIKYDVDSADLVSRVGGENVEKHVLPLIYSLMERDFEIFRIAQYKVIHVDELWDAVDNLLYVFSAIATRVQDLTSLFNQQQVDVASRMETVASGLLRYYYNSEGLWSMNNLWNPELNFYEGTPHLMDTDNIDLPKDVLRYPLQKEPSVDTSVFISGYELEEKVPTELDLKAARPLADILGRWIGYRYNSNMFPVQPMQEFYIHATSLADQTFEADGRDFNSGIWHMTGSCRFNDRHEIEVEFNVQGSNTDDAQYFQGYIDDSGALVGSMGWSGSVLAWNFIFKQLPTDVMMFYPSPATRPEDLARARWQFAIQCTLHAVRRNMWSWSYFAERRQKRKRYIQLNISYWFYGREPFGEELEEFLLYRRSLTPAEACFYRDIRDRLLEILPRHDNTCAGCFRPLGGVRIMCLDCQPETRQPWDTIDFCGHPDCNEWIQLSDSDRSHRQTHDFVKLRTVLHRRDMPRLIRSAQTALVRARTIWNLRPLYIAPPSLPVGKSAEENQQPDNSSLQETSSEHVFQLATGISHGVTVSPSSPSEPLEIQDLVPFLPRSAPPPTCAICLKQLFDPCWYCVTCSATFDGPDLFVCDTCEADSLLRCINCTSSFEQPRYFYGLDPKDTFLCNKCTLKGIVPPEIDKDIQHVCTHALVRVQDRIEDPLPILPPTVDQRIDQLERRVSTIDFKLDRLESRLQELISSQTGLEGRKPWVRRMPQRMRTKFYRALVDRFMVQAVLLR
ncbi:hypothetical protein QCA50_018958 [Cerrena zonata]|uniref:EF-hand domain-containing protein n=1 Tax=Cerrena zonata TaxID=2478898 RepID=A0AAW0FK84_9APHY